MIRATRSRLADIDQTIVNLRIAAKGRTMDDLSTDWQFGQACHFALQTIGEAVRHLPPDLRARYPEIPWANVIGFSNMLRHEYFRIDNDVIWSIIHGHLEPLHVVIQRMIAEEHASTSI